MNSEKGTKIKNNDNLYWQNCTKKKLAKNAKKCKVLPGQQKTRTFLELLPVKRDNEII